jgi:tRNA modification GTPase
MNSRDDTIAALATPVGTSALAVIRISGLDTKRLATELLGRAPLPRTVSRVDYRDRAGELIDDVLITFFPGPKSYTGDDVLELSSHGNPFIARRLLDDLYARGCRPAAPGEFTERAFLNGKMDLSQAEAVMDVIHARSERALAAAHYQLRGALGRRLQGLVDGLLAALARVEAYIDFPEEDLPTEDTELVAAEIDAVLRGTKRLLATEKAGAWLREGIATVILGEPNAGKSSLLNQLVGRDRALVSPEPGTTRDFIEERTVVGGHSLRLIDTAGLNTTPGAIEKLGIEKTVEQLESADLILVVIDASRPTPSFSPDILERFGAANTLLVFNKADLVGSGVIATTVAGLPPIPISALTGAGVGQLEKAISALADRFQESLGDEFVAVNARHALALAEVSRSLEDALKNLQERGPVELLASDLRSALDAVGQISGKVDNERMLDALFLTFCIGK